MKTRTLKCRECREDFTVYVNKHFKPMLALTGLPGCGHHTDKTRAGRRKDA